MMVMIKGLKIAGRGVNLETSATKAGGRAGEEGRMDKLNEKLKLSSYVGG